MARIQFVYTPEGGSQRKWDFDAENPAWDLAFVTETETGWPWDEFIDKLTHGSHIALRALVFAYRKRDEPRLSINAVTVTVPEFDFEHLEPEPKPKAAEAVEGEGEA
jgi:hypothetical protein